LKQLLLACLLAASYPASAVDARPAPAAPPSPGTVISGVKTTAYTHSESDHIGYGARTAAGTQLRTGQVRSAAADWSVFPLGTVFRINGDSTVYVVDDYGSALVGTRTIDLYKPTRDAMNRWGRRTVSIEILKWGSWSKSLAVLKPRATKARHVREMVTRLALRAAA
jgi:3D (Asp-Asp-Asp) domain-containing protein